MLVGAILPVALLAALLTVLASVGPASAGQPSARQRAASPATSPVTTSVTAAVTARRKPARDFPRMPRSCATPKEKIPQEPTACRLGTFRLDRPTVVLWGDSHAWMMIPALQAAARNQQVNLVAIVMGSCPPMDNHLDRSNRRTAIACARSNDLAIRYVRKLHRGGYGVRVVLNGSWQRYTHALKVHDRSSYVGQMAQRLRTDTPRLMRTLATMGVGVDVLSQVATVPARHRTCRKGNLPYACDLARGKALPERSATASWLRSTIAPLARAANVIDVNGVFCSAKVCHGRVGKVRTWFDDLHLSATRSRTLRRFFVPTIKAVTATTGQPDADPSTPGCQLVIFCR